MKRPTPDLSLKYWLLLGQRLFASPEGFTILETLMAILILAAVTGLIATPLMLTVGSRVQNRQVTAANQLAQQLMESARAILATYSTWTDPANPPTGIPGLATLPTNSYIDQIAAPTGSQAPCPTPSPDSTLGSASACGPTKVLPYAVGSDTFYVQAFRTSDQQTTTTTPNSNIVGFDLAIRVYAPAAVTNSQTRSNLSIIPANVGLRSNTVDATKPLVAFYSSLYRGSQGTSLSIIARLSSTTTPTATPTPTVTPTLTTTPTPIATITPTSLPTP